MFRSEVEDLLTSDISREIGSYLKSLGFKRGKGKKSAIAWKLLDHDGERLLEAHLHSTFMHVSAYEYRGWSKSRDLIVQALRQVLLMCASGQLQGVACGLAFVDVFINDSGTPYDPAEVFSESSEIISRTLFKSGASWKQDISWDVENDVRSGLNVKNRIVEPIDDSKKLVAEPVEVTRKGNYVTEVSLRLIVKVNSKDDQAVQWTEEGFNAKLNRLHGLNKSIMLDLLSDEMSKAIGLKE